MNQLHFEFVQFLGKKELFNPITGWFFRLLGGHPVDRGKKNKMVEVFKTDITNDDEAKKLVSLIHDNFTHYQANFDLEDCDRILRIKCDNDQIDTDFIQSILKNNGCNATVLLDDFEPIINPLR